MNQTLFILSILAAFIPLNIAVNFFLFRGFTHGIANEVFLALEAYDQQVSEELEEMEKTQ